jgi:multidrug efflux pump subunit AcrB
MSFGSPTPIDVAVSGPNLQESRAYAEKIRGQLAEIESLRDLQFSQSLDYPTVEVNVDRVKAGKSGVTPADLPVARPPPASPCGAQLLPEPKSASPTRCRSRFD